VKDPGLADATRRAVRLWRTDGPARLASIALHLAASPLVEFGHLAFFARELDADAGWPKLPSGLEIRQAEGADLPGLVSAGRRDPALAEERFQRGDQCVIAVDPEGRIVHNRWVTVIPTPIPELRQDLCPRRDEAYFYDGYTRPEARSLGLDSAVRCYIFEALRRARFERVYSYVRGDNRPGLRAASRWQACVGELSFIRFRGVAAWVVSRHDADRSRSPWPDLH